VRSASASVDERVASLCGSNPDDLPALLVRPEHYEINLTIAEPTSAEVVGGFGGKMRLRARASEASARCLALHAVNMTLNDVMVRRESGGTIVSCTAGVCSGGVSLVYTSSAVVFLPGSGVFDGLGDEVILLETSYQASFGERSGLYKAQLSSKPREAVTVTQLETKGARQVFPSVDEPGSKATFRITIDVPSELVALSNMDVAEARVADGRQSKTFETTPVMSPYLLALAIGEFHSLDSEMNDGTLVKVWSTTEQDLETLEVALDASVKALEFYTSWTDQKMRDFKKFDLVAVPGRGGAMENWGLLLFDERRFLVNVTDGFYERLECYDVTCHEIAHQWMGNLVTAASWDDISFNEGFATFMEYKCLSSLGIGPFGSSLLFEVALTPLSGKLGVHFPGARSQALAYDVGEKAHPLVGDHFDKISYSKGAAVVSMIEAIAESLSPGSFQSGIRSCLREKAYSTTTYRDMLACAFQLHDPAILALADYWVFEDSYPVISKPEGGVIARYLDRDWVPPTAFMLPLRSWDQEKNIVNTDMVLVSSSFTPLPENVASNLEGTILNYGGRGYFRVVHNLSDYREMLRAAAKDGGPETIVTLARMVDDLIHLVDDGLVDGSVLLRFSGELESLRECNSSNAELCFGVVLPVLRELRLWEMFCNSSKATSVDIAKTLFLSNSSADGIFLELVNEHLAALGRSDFAFCNDESEKCDVGLDRKAEWLEKSVGKTVCDLL